MILLAVVVFEREFKTTVVTYCQIANFFRPVSVQSPPDHTQLDWHVHSSHWYHGYWMEDFKFAVQYCKSDLDLFISRQNGDFR